MIYHLKVVVDRGILGYDKCVSFNLIHGSVVIEEHSFILTPIMSNVLNIVLILTLFIMRSCVTWYGLKIFMKTDCFQLLIQILWDII